MVSSRLVFFLLPLFILGACKEGATSQKPVAEPETPSSPKLIDEAGRQYLWEIEHRVNFLKKSGFSQMGSALSENDGASLRAIFPKGYRGQEFPKQKESLRYESDQFSVGLAKEDHKSPLAQAETPIADRLLALVSQLGEGERKTKVHIITLSPVSIDEQEGAWKGTGKLEVFCTGAQGALAELVVGFEFRVDDLREERLIEDGWLTDLKVTKILRGQSQKELMRDVTAEMGIPLDLLWDNWKVPREKRMANTGGVYLNDFNRDGLTDLFVTDVNASFFFVGRPGGGYLEISQALKINGNLGGGYAAFVDLDGDGWEDLIHGVAQHPDGLKVYQNVQGRFFDDVTQKSNLPEILLGLPLAKARALLKKKVLPKVKEKATGISIADYDLDGKVDLYVTRGAGASFKSGSWIDGKSGKVANNELLRNLGDWQFEDVTNGYPLDGGQRSTSNAVWIHADEDLYPDLYVIDEFGDGLFLSNQGDGTFKGALLNEGPTDFGSMGMTAGDINNDGYNDIYIAEMYSKAGQRVFGNIPPGTYDEVVMQKLKRMVNGSQLYLGGANRHFQATEDQLGANAVGWAWGAALADLNNDGWLDLFGTAGYISHDRSKPDG